MSLYLEIPDLNPLFPFRTFICQGWEITYPHWHKEIEFIYCLKGSVNLGTNDRIIQLQEGEIYFFYSGEPQFFLASPDSERIVYQFDLKMFHENANLQETDRNLYQLFLEVLNHSAAWPTEMTAEIKKLLLEIFEISQQAIEGQQYAITGKLYQIISLFYRLPIKETQQQLQSAKKIYPTEALEQLNLIFEYVEAHFENTITLDEVASHIGFSSSYFSRFFKKNVGLTFSRYLMEYRINHAKYILGTENIPMTEVASRSGFASIKTFHHVFKAAVGMAPFQFQKKYLLQED
ncbi:AraC-like DNA-binding protein [Enterococcus sp. PF1-24]|uniref:AraC family transcriptional regulator n=1 Tax=unclassified Enterococcus TaxID=2608891 RepID=UPI00247500F2|nr:MULTISPECIES: AraC family transcriptional regulator [unclassified Enterococcus]MDH6363439.1 AraC-like DNA-binding protein [Enterococcus sp. PFB1-1]MDH6400533.1 AraC-like DNA-binding protein [Enterococcus sp. PF1-24]